VDIVFSQTAAIRGHVSDKQGNNLFAVNVFLLKQSTIGTISGRAVVQVVKSSA
jgi:hypothetical protein